MGLGWNLLTAGLLAMAPLAAAADLQPGMPAPVFQAPDQNGHPVRLTDYLGKSVVLYFYPKDNTPGCTAEACSLAKGYTDILATGAVVLGVSADTVASHAGFAEQNHLPFPILADPDGEVIKTYGVKMPVLTRARRVTFIIDKGGIIRHIITDVDTGQHDRQVLELLKKM